MALTKISGEVIQVGTGLSAGIITATNVSVSSTINVGSATTIHTGGFQIGSSDLHSTGLTVQNINATGVVTANSFYGDASNLTGIPAGLGTALSQDQSSSLNQLYYTDKILSVGSTITVNPPDSSNIAYTQYAEIAVEEGFDLIVEDGDDLVPDILGLSTETAGVLAGAGGRVRADNFTNKAGTGAPTFPNGVNVTGVLTATSFSGDGSALTGIDATSLKDSGDTIRVQANTSGAVVTGVLTATSFSGDLTGNATGLSGTPNLNVGVLTATSFSGDGSALTGIAITSVTGNLTVTSGNLVLSSGNGIDFSATSDAAGMTSELLDDYEEGTWTVQVNNTTVSSNVTARYTKIGNKVTCECRFDSATFPTFSGNLEVSLPFAMASGISIYPHGPFCYFYPLANWDQYSNFVGFRPYVAPGSSRALFSIKLVDGDWQTSLSSSNTNVSGQSGLYLEFQLTYWTSWT